MIGKIMSSNPLNLFIRFALELGALFALGFWGWNSVDGWPRFLIGFGAPILAAVLWGTFAVPDDPSRSGKAPVPIPGLLRLILELTILGGACWALFSSGFKSLSLIAGFVLILHYAFSYDRVLWLLGIDQDTE